MPTRPAHPIYFTKLVLENVRCFSERQQLSLTGTDGRPTRWTLLVGDNGVGKTTLLQCLARMRPVFNPPEGATRQQTDPGPVEPELADEADNEELGALARSSTDTRALLEAYLSVGVPLAGTEAHCPDRISTRASITRSAGALTEFKTGGELPDGLAPEDVEEPLVLAYGAGRHPPTIDLDRAVANGSVESLFRVEDDLLSAEQLLYRLDYRSSKKDEQAQRQLDSLKRMLVEILPDISGTPDIEIHGPPVSDSFGGRTGVWVTTPYGTVPLKRLSLGYQTVLAWTIDIAWRLIDRYPQSHNPIEEPAIVIVDEIDLHLHPKWQRAIRKHLTDHFPKVQFIATAHSPLMAQSSLSGNLAVLQQCEDHALIRDDPPVVQGWRLDHVITSDLFGLLSARSPAVEALVKERQELVQKEKRSADEEKRLAELDRRVRALPTAESSEDQEALDIIRTAALALRQQGDDQ